METITYVTGNYGKYISVKDYFAKSEIELLLLDYDFKEPEINDIEKISKSKAKVAYDMLHTPCFAIDSGFYIDDYPGNPGYPGAFVKRSGISNDIDALLETMKNVSNRNCKFIDCLTFYDGVNYYSFYGESKGTLAYEKRGSNMKKSKSNLWLVFVPQLYDKTLAEMTDEERNNRNDGRTSATPIFMDWYKNVYLKNHGITNTPSYHRYIDCNGVIIDTETDLLDAYYEEKLHNPQLTRSQHLQKLDWQEWLKGAKVINDALEILKCNNSYNTDILTRIHSLQEGKAKIEYFRKHGIQNNIFLVPNGLNKPQVVSARGNLLVDNAVSNLNGWVNDGGIPIQFSRGIGTSNYPQVDSLVKVFSKETEDYCMKMRLTHDKC